MTQLEKLQEEYPDVETIDVVWELNAFDFKHQKRKQNEQPMEGGAIGVAWISDRDVVLTYRTKPHSGWALPGGRVEIGEKFDEAFVRELEEETSVKAKVNGLLLIEKKIFTAPDGEELPLVLGVFNAVADEHQSAVTTEDAREEGLEIAVYDIENLPEQMILRDREKVELAIEFMKKRTAT